MSEQPPRDWDKELAAIDRAMERAPAPSPAAPAPGKPAAGPVRPGALAAPARSRRDVALAWTLVLLAIVVAGALVFWPYVNSCGFGLLGYLGAVGGLVLLDLWALATTWRARSGLAHVLALLTLLFSLGLLARELLPRMGYARETRTWDCVATPQAAPSATPSAPSATQPAQTPPAQRQP